MIATLFGFALRHWRGAGAALIAAAALAWGGWQMHEAAAARAQMAAVQAKLEAAQTADELAAAAAAARQQQLTAYAMAQAHAIASQMSARAQKAQADLSAARADQRSLEQEITNANASATAASRHCADLVLPGGVQHAIAAALRDANRHGSGTAVQNIQPRAAASAGVPARGSDGLGGG